MDPLIRTSVLVGGLVGLVLLLYLNRYVAEKHWLPTIEDDDDDESVDD